MTRFEQGGVESPRAASWYGPGAMVASVLALVSSVLLSQAVSARILGWQPWVWSKLPAGAVYAVAGVWLALVVAGVVFAVIALALPHRRLVWPILAIVLSAGSLLLVPAVAAASAFVWIGPHHPSDSDLIANFRKHESQFIQAVHRLNNGAELRLADLDRLGITAAMPGSHGQVEMPVSSWGLVPSGSAKGYVYSRRPLSPVVKDLDDSATGDGYTYRHIEGPWYLYYEFW